MNLSKQDILDTLKQQGITNLDDLVKATIEAKKNGKVGGVFISLISH